MFILDICHNMHKFPGLICLISFFSITKIQRYTFTLQLITISCIPLDFFPTKCGLSPKRRDLIRRFCSLCAWEYA